MNTLKSATLWIIIIALFILLSVQGLKSEQSKPLRLKEFMDFAEKGQIVSANDRDCEIEGEYYLSPPPKPKPPEKQPGKDSAKHSASAEAAVQMPQTGRYTVKYIPGQQAWIADQLVKVYKVDYDGNARSNVMQQLLISVIIPVAVIIGLWLLVMRQIQAGGNKAMSFGKSRAKLVSEGQVKVTFNDVAGVDEAKQELKEIVEFLKDPKKFARLGGKIPKGVLLYGRPGTGKTLLAKAVAGEANVPFFSISGSDFVEMFVGVGASRVRDLFEQGKRSKPCLIFIDEIDAVGRHRFAGIGGGHDEREQTLNQLLVEMDGFDANEGVILIAATNRPDVLDPALLRPGRFDRQVAIDFPDLRGREQILLVHAKHVKLEKVADLKPIARGTPGFSGADLANVINEAALLAARRSHPAVQQADLEEARDRVMMGPERRSLVLTDREKRNTAFHEAGHTLVQVKTPDSDPIHKVTIIPRGQALGLTSALPQEDRYTQTEQQLRNALIMMMGGRVAEKLHLKEFTTGASNDLQRATGLATRMVCEFGMSERLGPRIFGERHGEVFLGKDIGRERNFSEQTAALIDEEVKKILDEAEGTASKIIKENQDILVRIADALIERETLTGDDIALLLEGRELPPVETHLGPPSAGDARMKDQSPADRKTPPPIPHLTLERPPAQA